MSDGPIADGHAREGRGEGSRWRDEQDGRYVSKLTEDLIVSLEQVLVSGLSPEHAAQSVGISKRTYWYWWREGQREGCDPIYREFVERVQVAIASWASGVAAAATTAARKDGRVAIELLERRGFLPGRRTRLDHGNADGEPFRVLGGTVDLSKLSVEQLEAWRELLALAAPDDGPTNVIDMGERRAIEG